MKVIPVSAKTRVKVQYFGSSPSASSQVNEAMRERLVSVFMIIKDN